jgi:hypothetical protein
MLLPSWGAFGGMFTELIVRSTELMFTVETPGTPVIEKMRTKFCPDAHPTLTA